MASNQDIVVTIKAKDDASAAAATVIASLQGLVGASSKVGESVELAQNQVTGLAKVLSSLNDVSGKATKGSLETSESIKRLGENLTASGAETAKQITKMAELSIELAKVNSQIERQAMEHGFGDHSDKTDYATQAANIEKLYNTINRANAKTEREIKNTTEALSAQKEAFNSFSNIQDQLALATFKANAEMANAKSVLDANKEAVAANAAAKKEAAEAEKAEAQAAAAAKNEQAEVEKAHAQAIATEDAAIQKFRDNLDPTATEIGKLSNEQEQLDNWFMVGKIKLDEYQEGSERLRAKIEQLQERENSLVGTNEKVVESTDRLTAAGQRWKDALDPTLPILRAQEAQLKELDALEHKGILTDIEAAKAREKLNEQTEKLVKQTHMKKDFSLFGLEWYETNNLMYQLNDIISGFAMGQKPMQILAQQGGQVFQIFQTKLGPAFNKFRQTVMSFQGAAVMGAFAAATVVAVTTTTHLIAKMEDLNRATAMSNLNVDIKPDSIESIAKTETALRHLGVTGVDAMSAIAKAKSSGLDDVAFKRVQQTALSLSIAFGEDLKGSLDVLTKAFAGNYHAIDELDEKYNFLSVAQAKHINDLIDEGKNQEAGTEALRIFHEKMDKTATQMEGTWALALRRFKEGWNDFFDAVADLTPFNNLIAKIHQVLSEGDKLKKALAGGASKQDIQTQIAVVQHRMDTNGDGMMTYNDQAKLHDQWIINDLKKRLQETAKADEEGSHNSSVAKEKKTNDFVGDQEDKILSGMSYDQARRRGMSANEYLHAADHSITSAYYRSVSAAGIDGQDPNVRAIAQEKLDAEHAKRQKSIDDAASKYARKRDSEAKRLQALIDEQRKKQESLNLAVDSETEKAKHNTEIRARTNDLTGVALIQTKEQIELEDALLAMRKQVQQANINRKPGQKEYVLSQDRINAFTQAKTDEMYSRDALPVKQAQLSEYDKPVKMLEQQRDRISQIIQGYAALGQNGVVEQYEKQLLDVNKQLKVAAETADKMYESIEMGGEESARSFGMTADQVANMRDQLKKDKEAGEQFGHEFMSSGKSINEELSGGLTQSFVSFADAIGQGSDAITALKRTFVAFANDFLTKMIEMIAKQYVFNKISGIGKGGTGESGVGGGIMGFLGKMLGFSGGGAAASASAIPSMAALPTASELMATPILHGGGDVGSGGLRRQISTAVFNGARKFHKGTMPGLSHDEIPAILQKGEHVLTQAQQKSLAEKSAAKSGNDMITNITAFNDSDIAQAMSGAHGTRVIMNMMSRNSTAFKQILR